MAFIFNRSRHRGNRELCQSTKDLLTKTSVDGKSNAKSEEEMSKNLSQMRQTLQESDEAPQQAHELIVALLETNILLPLANSIHLLPFESRKDVQAIFGNIFRAKPRSDAEQAGSVAEAESSVLRHVINEQPEIIIALCRGYDHRESAMACGNTLREAIKHDSMTALILYDEPGPGGQSNGLNGVDPNVPSSGTGVFWKFFDWIDKSAFEVSADAFSTFRELLTRHKKLISHYLVVNYERFTSTYNNKLLLSPQYVTKRQSVKLLGELLLERTNYNLMTAYIASAANLKIAMNLLRDDRRMVQYEGFHVFKIFVANPNKSEEVTRILCLNRDRLLRFLPTFMEDREEDAQFKDEKAYLVQMIQRLPQ